MHWTYFALSLLLFAGTSSADLRSDLRDFANLIPANRVAFITGRHYLFDASFRAAFNYLRSPHFESMVRREISRNDQVQDVIEYLDRDIDLNVIPKIFKRLVIEPKSAQEYIRVRTLTSYLREIADTIPDYKIANLIRQKSSADPNFADLKAKISNPRFKTLVYKARNAPSLARSFKILRNNQVNIDELLTITFQKLNTWSNL